MPVPQFFPPSLLMDALEELPGTWKAAREELRSLGRVLFKRSASRRSQLSGRAMHSSHGTETIPWPGPRRTTSVASADVRCA